jgi:hypothetical protein
VSGHAGTNPFSGSALTHGFSIAFYVLAALAAAGAVLSAVLLESNPASPEAAYDGERLEQLEAAA